MPSLFWYHPRHTNLTIALLVAIAVGLQGQAAQAQNRLQCDLNQDFECTAADLSSMTATIRSGTFDPRFDADGDEQLTRHDLSVFLETALNRVNGDLDLSGDVGFDDFLIFADNFAATGDWAQGDFDADGAVGFSDFLILSTNFGATSRDLDISVETLVTEDLGQYVYEYVVSNLSTSPMPLNIVGINVGDGPGVVQILDPLFDLVEAPNNWMGIYNVDFTDEELFFFSDDGVECIGFGLLPGESETFVIRSEFAPTDGVLAAAHTVFTCDLVTAAANAVVPVPSGGNAIATTTVPEPSCRWMIGCGLSFVSLRRSRRTRTSTNTTTSF